MLLGHFCVNFFLARPYFILRIHALIARLYWRLLFILRSRVTDKKRVSGCCQENRRSAGWVSGLNTLNWQQMRFTRRRNTHGRILDGIVFFLLVQQLLLEFLAQSHQKLVLKSSRFRVCREKVCRHLGISTKCALATHLVKGSSLKALCCLPLLIRLSLHWCHLRGVEQIRLNGKCWVTNGDRALRH